jgi:tRNA-splicing ligase RtcB
MQVIQSNKPNKVIYSWCPNIDQNALDQAKLLVEQLFVFRHMSLMPDTHKGTVMPIGGVLATKDVILPFCVGSDGGCGMCAVKTSLKIEDFREGQKEELLHSMERSVPVGFQHNDEKRMGEIRQKYIQKIEYLLKKNEAVLRASTRIFQNVPKTIEEQVGTLGGGNHFCEIQYDQDENIWIMIHSGSRNIGTKICDTFNDIAIDLNKKYYSQVPESIPFLPTNTMEAKEYLAYMNFALDFAFLNRQIMMDYIKKDISFSFKHMQVDFEKMINIHHNYASLENHFGENVWIHRKGATLATKGTIGIIPGAADKNSASYIVRGKGNPDSYNSCSHGAGRVMGRKAFNQIYNTPEKMREIVSSLDGITHSKFKKEQSYKKNKETGLLDVSEAGAAYKNVFSVMKNQEDLVEIVTTLKTYINMKG